MWMILRNLGVFGVVLFVILTTVSVASSINVDSTRESMKEDIEYLDYLLDMNISSGSFLDLDLAKSPMSMTIITKEMISITGARNISELLEIYVPGFQYMFNLWNGTMWGLRGVASDRNCKIIFLVNGHKLNTQARDGFMSEVVLGLLGDIERVEVLRGPAGLVYGSGAIAGIINVVTKKNDGNKTQITTSYGSNNSKSVEANFHAELSKKQQFSFFAGFRSSDGLPSHQSRVYGLEQWPYPFWLSNEILVKGGIPSDGNYGSTDGNWKIAADWGIGNFNLYFRMTHQIENAGGWFILDPWPELKNSTPIDSTIITSVVDGKTIRYDDPFWSQAGESNGNNLRQYLNENIMAECSYNQLFGANELKWKIGFDGNTTRIGTEKRERYLIESEIQEKKENGTTIRYWDPPHPARSNGYITETFGETRYTFNSMYLLKSIPRLQLATGVEYRLDHIGKDLHGDNEEGESSLHPVVSNINYSTISLFSEGFYDITNTFGVHLGGRLDFHSRAFMANPKIALVFRPSDAHSIKLIYQTSSNNGSADNYEYNRNHFDEYGNVITELSFEHPYARPSTSSPILPVFNQIDSLHKLKPEKSRSLEITSTHNIGNFLTIMPSFSYGQITDLFGWSQVLFREVNIGKYDYVNVDLDSKVDIKYLKFGANHTFQRPVGMNVNSLEKAFVRSKIDVNKKGWYDSTFEKETNRWKYYPVYSKSAFDTIRINIVKDAITADGENFLNLNTNVTKFYLTILPSKWVAIHTNLRLFWGLPGRDAIYDKDEGFNYLHINDSREDLGLVNYLKKCVSKKLNASIHFYLPHDFEISLLGYDLLGLERSLKKTDDNFTINTVRWQQMATPKQKALYSTDQQAFSLCITKSF